MGSIEAFESAIISEPFPLITVGLSFRSSKQAFNRKVEAPAATGSRTQGLPKLDAVSAASSMAGNQSEESVPTLIQSALMWGVKSGISSEEWSIAGEAPAERRVLAIKSMETKFVMHWMSGDWRRTSDRKDHVFLGQLIDCSGFSSSELGSMVGIF